MKALIADDPAHRLMTKPTDTTSACPLFRMVSTVWPTRFWATSALKMPLRKMLICSWTLSMVSGPNQFAT